MAAPAVSGALDAAQPEGAGSARSQPGIPDADPGPLGCESALGLAQKSRGTAEARHCSGQIQNYRVRPRRPPSPSWRAFLNNHLSELVALDFFTVPTVGFKVLFVLIVLAHDRQRILHFNLTEHSTAQWTAQ
ncbi:MAG TPA: hypothetical protein VMD08_05360 [Candidatus Baltobacteraceae bacterium]|nr:hypothetical protein [Candidatus Baltobacteraceae bacterium]